MGENKYSLQTYSKAFQQFIIIKEEPRQERKGKERFMDSLIISS